MLLKLFSDENSCEEEFMLKYRKNISAPNSNDNGTVEMRDVQLILPPAAICGGTNRAAKTRFLQ